MTDSQPTPAEVLSRFDLLVADKGPVRQRDAAHAIGVSEGALVHAKATRGDAVALRGGDEVGLGELLLDMPAVGEVMVLTRNASCVHEKYGVFEEVSVGGDMGRTMGMVVGEHVDLRLFFNHWRHGFLVTEETRSGRRESLQIFDGTGNAVHKIYKTDKSDAVAFARLLQRHTDGDPPASFEQMAQGAPVEKTTDADVDVRGLRETWIKLQHTHDFFSMLKKFGVTRQQAFRLVGARTDDPNCLGRHLAEPVGQDAARRLLNGASQTGVSIMCFVGNPGCLQIHSGPVKRIEVMGPWLNVLDPTFNLHLREDRIADSWIVRKPTSYGAVTSLELFDEDGYHFCQFFGTRKLGGSEQGDWRAMLEDFAFSHHQREVD